MGEHRPAHAAGLGLVDDCWIEIFRRLPPREIVRARHVSKQLHKVLTDSEVSRRLLQLMFPQCREVRLDVLQHRLDNLPDMPHNLRVEVECRAQQMKDWSEIFATVARRYHHLESGTPREYLKLPMPELVDHTTPDDCISKGYCRDTRAVCPSCRFKVAQSSGFFWMNVPVWPRNFAFREHSHESDFPEPMWWYSQEDGLLVYPAAWPLDSGGSPSVKWTEMERNPAPKDNGSFRQSFDPPTARCEDFFYRLFDLETGEHIRIPFNVRGKIIRRVRLAQGVLVFEWVQATTDGAAIDGEEIKKTRGYKAWAKHHKRTWFEYLARNAHMVTVFNVVRTPLSNDTQSPRSRAWTWDITLRHEWKLPSWGTGPPREGQEIYNRDDDDDDGPLEYGPICDYRPRFFSAHTATHYALFILTKTREDFGRWHRQLFVWDIATAKQDGSRGSNTKKPKRSGPTFVRRLDEEDVRYYQDVFLETEDYPSFRNIGIDEHNVYLVHDDHHWAPFDYYQSNTTGHALRSHGIPVIPFRSAHDTPIHRSSSLRQRMRGPVFGPQSMDHCPGSSSPGGFILETELRSRPDNDEEPPITTVFCRHFVYARQNDPRLRGTPLTPSPPYSSLPEALLPSAADPRYPWDVSDAISHPLQPRNFPGYTPCWRHENFPYIGISVVTDYAAGVRWVARDSRPLQLLTPLLKPTITVNVRGSRRVEDNAEVQNGIVGGDNAGNAEGDGAEWILPRAALLNPHRPPPPNRGPLTMDEVRERYRVQRLLDTGGWDENQPVEFGERDSAERDSDHYCWPDYDPVSFPRYYNRYDFDPLTGYLEELRHPFKFEPEPRNIREDEVEVRCPGFWENMMGRMTLAGDERWLVGQDAENRITLLRF
ncbi:hypothetical protein GE09DRAFT_325808 [Coniochaeta sp. 2T2.1]|nr:hypothetical protein GE09DRAFT_325808 [Coniochaeta sp. 2T2.1]